MKTFITHFSLIIWNKSNQSQCPFVRVANGVVYSHNSERTQMNTARELPYTVWYCAPPDCPSQVIETPFSHSIHHSLTHIRLVFLNDRSKERTTIRFTVWPFSSVLWRRALWDNEQLSWSRPHRFSSRMGNNSPARKWAQGVMPYLQGVILSYSNQAIPQPMRWWRSWWLCWIPWEGEGGCGIHTSFVWFFYLGNG